MFCSTAIFCHQPNPFQVCDGDKTVTGAGKVFNGRLAFSTPAWSLEFRAFIGRLLLNEKEIRRQ
jgi:hypothetical protein